MPLGHLRWLSPYACHKEDSNVAEVNSWRMEPTIEKISAVTLRVANMMESVRLQRCSGHGASLWWRGRGFLFAARKRRTICDPQSGTGRHGDSLGTASPPRHECGRVMDSSERKGIRSGNST